MICPRCKLDNLAGAGFCEGCGTSLTEPQPPIESERSEIQQKIEEVKTELKDALKLEPEEIQQHLSRLRDNLKIGRGNLKARLGRIIANLKSGNMESILKNNEKSLKNMIIGFIAWAILRFSTPYHPRIIAFLLSPLGLLALLILSYVYGVYEKEIQKKVEEMRRGESL